MSIPDGTAQSNGPLPSGQFGVPRLRHHAAVSVIVRFFAAPDHQAAVTVVERGPEDVFEWLPFGTFDPDEALIEWAGILTGDRGFKEIVSAGEPAAFSRFDAVAAGIRHARTTGARVQCPGRSSPDSWARTTSWARSRSPRLPRRLPTWVLMVLSARQSTAPISVLDMPRPTRRSTSSSR